MKRLILNTLILASFLIALSAIGINTSSACWTTESQFITQVDDPNEPQPEPQPEIILGGIELIYLDEDPNEPGPETQPEIALYGLKLTFLADEPNEPQPEPQPE